VDESSFFTPHARHKQWIGSLLIDARNPQLPRRMTMTAMRLTYIGGPTAVLEWRGVRLLTDPTFDPAGTRYDLGGYTLEKSDSPAIAPADIGSVDAILLSHDHHFDNLDRSGREYLRRSHAPVLTTADGAARLGGNAIGLQPWNEAEIAATTGATLRATATPARHGPAGGDRGPVIGFALTSERQPRGTVYMSGDTVWFDGVAAVAERFDVDVAILNAGAARIAAAGDQPLTFTAADALRVARAMPRVLIVPLHFEGWRHLSESGSDLENAFDAAAEKQRLRLPHRGETITITSTGSTTAAPSGGAGAR
jgi:L-ascorbate metabolism protein UlaG (beta-lactamase superfamily)